MAKLATAVKILTLDIGGSHIKATILNGEGKLQMEYEKVATPLPANPDSLISSIKALVKDFPAYEKFPQDSLVM